MSKRVNRKPPALKRKMAKRYKGLLSIVFVLSLSLAGIILAQWRSSHRSFNSSALVPTTTPTPQLSKEYIYAGGKLIATEEPRLSSILSAPSSLIATGVSTPQVNLTWTAATGGTVDHYQVERMDSLSAGYSVIATSVTSTTYPDIGVSAGKAYLYRVRAFDASNNYTNYTSPDLATTINFDDDPLYSYSESPTNATVIRAVHFTQLRDAINAVRCLVDPNAADFQWTAINNNPLPPQVGAKSTPAI